jgi:hypothetical protein
MEQLVWAGLFSRREREKEVVERKEEEKESQGLRTLHVGTASQSHSRAEGRVGDVHVIRPHHSSGKLQLKVFYLLRSLMIVQ